MGTTVAPATAASTTVTPVTAASTTVTPATAASMTVTPETAASTTVTPATAASTTVTPATTTGQYNCTSGLIISMDKVCDGKYDCPRTETTDEGEEENDCTDGSG